MLTFRLIQQKEHTVSSLAEAWGVTEQVISWRMNAVGASRRVRSAA
jgi:hypothetical protein